MRRGAIYARVSRNDLHDRHGVEAQLKACRKLAGTEGIKVIAEHFDDDTSAWSGKKSRPEYAALLSGLGDIDVVVALAPDRLTRRTKELVELIDALETAGVDVLTVQGGRVDLATAGGRTAAKLAGVLAEHESELKSERNKLRHATIAAEGRPNGGTRPYGFESDRVTHRPAEVAVIRAAADRVLTGESLSSVCRDLNARGIRTAQGAAWRTPTLRKILTAPRTAGLREHRGQLHDATWEPIIAVEDRQRITATVADPNRSKPRGRPRRLLSGLATCGRCGAPLRSRIRSKTGQVEYLCASQPGVAACGGIGIQGDPLEELIESTVLALVGSGNLPIGDRPAEGPDAAGELTALDNRADEYARMAATGEITAAAYGRFTGALDAQRAKLMEATAANVSTLHRSRIDPDTLVDRWPTMTVEARRSVLDAVIETVVIGPANAHTPIADRVSIGWKV